MKINVLIGGVLPRLLLDIVRTLVHREPDIHVVAADLNAVEMLDHVDRHPPDVVIIGCDKAQMDEVSHRLLDRSCLTKVIAITASDCDAVLYQLAPISRRLGQLSTDSLLSAIRDNGSAQRDVGV